MLGVGRLSDRQIAISGGLAIDAALHVLALLYGLWESLETLNPEAVHAVQVMDSLSHPALLLVDGVSSIGGLDFQMDAWKVDMAVTGSQKALSLPTGLAVVAASPKVCHACCSPHTVHDKQRTAQPVLASCWCHLRARTAAPQGAYHL